MTQARQATHVTHATYVALTLDGHHLCLDDGAETRLRVGPPALDRDAVFERLDLGHGRIALRTLEGRYLATHPDTGQNYGIYPDDELTPAAAFEEILWPDGRVSLRSCLLTYVGAGAHGDVTVNRITPGVCERFSLVPVSLPTVPEQRRRGPVPAGSVVGTPRDERLT
jgi:hypothetical protein